MKRISTPLLFALLVLAPVLGLAAASCGGDNSNAASGLPGPTAGPSDMFPSQDPTRIRGIAADRIVFGQSAGLQRPGVGVGHQHAVGHPGRLPGSQ